MSETISGEIISALFKLIFCDIYENNMSPDLLQPEAKNDSYFITIDRIITNYHKDVNLKILSEKLNLSTKQTSRIVRKYYKMTLSELICKKRLGVASELLINSDMPISDIIEHINFPSESYFFARFKKEYGLTPLKYREASRK
jgi:AraC-like DNA-binding protein